MKGATSAVDAYDASDMVSIHAPMKGATVINANDGELVDVSIHAPMKGATPGGKQKIVIINVSIHAPMKGATAKGRFYSLFCVYRWGYFPTDTVCSY